MSYGLQAISAAGYIQVDETYANHSLVQAGTATTGTPFSVSGMGTAKKLVFVRFPYGRAIARGYPSAADSILTVAADGGADFAFEYRVFERISSSPSSGYGLHVFDGSGGLTFDSNLQYARIRARASVRITTSSSFSLSVTVPGIGAQPWVWLYPLYEIAYVPIDPMLGSDIYALSAKVLADNSVVFAGVPIGTGPYMPYVVVFDGIRTLLLAL